MWTLLKSLFSVIGNIFNALNNGLESVNKSLDEYNQQFEFNGHLKEAIKELINNKEQSFYKITIKNYTAFKNSYDNGNSSLYYSKDKGIFFDYEYKKKIYCVKLEPRNSDKCLLVVYDFPSSKLIAIDDFYKKIY